ncbi:MAG: ABC transporter ATP-binding protein [Planctomycetota bacterium]
MIQRSDLAGAPMSVDGLSVAYRTEPVLWNVTWSARAGAMTAIVGPNGAGKTTLLNAALGLVPSLAGHATFWGRPFDEVRDRVAYVPQRESVDWDFPVTVLEVVEMGATRRLGWLLPSWARRITGVSSPEKDAARDALVRVGMLEFADRPIGQLSGGQQQRVFLARALAQGAELFLLDEPFTGVDAATEVTIADELRRLTREGRTVIAVHHDLDSVAARFDDALLLDGQVVASGSVQDALARHHLDRAYGATEAAAVAAHG